MISWRKNALLFRPKVIIAGISCYARPLDYARFRSLADKCGAYVLADMAHIAGLVAAGVISSPFEYADIVTTTTHKSLRGPRGALIFYRKGVRSENAKGEKILYDIGPKIDSAVFPGLQGGPHNHTISAIAVALKQCLTTEFVDYGHQVVKNAKALAAELNNLGYCIVTGGTDVHLCLVDLRPSGLDGSRVEKVLDACGIVCNMNTCPGDKSALKPGGIRLGTCGLTSRGFKEDDFKKVANYIHQAIDIFRKNQSRAGTTQKEFKQFVDSDKEFHAETQRLATEIDTWAGKFYMPGNDEI